VFTKHVFFLHFCLGGQNSQNRISVCAWVCMCAGYAHCAGVWTLISSLHCAGGTEVFGGTETEEKTGEEMMEGVH